MFTRISIVPITFMVLLLLLAPTGMGQFQKGGKGGFTTDPKERFAQMAKGRDFITLDDVNPFVKDMYAKIAGDMGIKDGKITLEKYLQISEQMRAMKGSGMFGKGGPKGGGGPPGGPGGGMRRDGSSPGSPPKRPVEVSPSDLQKMAEEAFKRADRNNKGYLEPDDMDDVLRRDYAHWDKNQNHQIDKEEFIPYFIERYQKEQREKVQAEAMGAERRVYEDELDQRPVVYRYGALPRDLPPWFTELDKNKDGMVSLGEWRRGEGKTPEDFFMMDRNNDGLLTADEVLRYQNGDNPVLASTQAPSRGFFGFGGKGPGGGQRGPAAATNPATASEGASIISKMAADMENEVNNAKKGPSGRGPGGKGSGKKRGN